METPMWNRLKAILADFIQQADLVLLGLCCAATLYGMALIASATRYLNIGGIVRYVGVQGAAMVLGICAYIFMSMLDLERLMRRWKWLVAFNVVFIALLLTPFGVSDNTGNTAWLKFPFLPFSIGPAEVVKITFTLLLAKQLEWLREVKRDLKSFPSALMVAGHTIALMGWYVGISGDMGNGLTFFFIFLCMAFVAGFALRWFVLLFIGSGAANAASVVLGLLPDYMLHRSPVSWLAAAPGPAGPGLRRPLRPGIHAGHPDPGGGGVPAGPAHGLHLLCLRGGAGDDRLSCCDRPAGGHHHPGAAGGTPG